VQESVLRRVTMKSSILRLDRHHQRAAETDTLENLQNESLRTSSLLKNCQLRRISSHVAQAGWTNATICGDIPDGL